MNKSIRSSVIWATLGRYSQMIVSLIVTMVLSRLLTPDEFGIVATVLIFNNFLYTFIDAGIPSAIIQKKKLSNNDLNTYNTIGFIIGLSLLILMISVSGTIADFFSTEELSFLIPIMGINLVLLGLLGTPTGVLQRNLQFAKLAKIEIASSVISGTIAIYLAYKDFGYWALVLQLISQLVVRLILSLFANRCFYYSIELNRESIIYLKEYAGYLVLFSSINYWSRNVDNLVIARFYNDTKLGLYSQAYRLMFLPVQLISSIINSLVHPYFAKKINKGEGIYDVYALVFGVSIVLSAPISSFMYFNPELTLKLIWGDQWSDAGSVLSILSILSLIQPALVTTGDIFKSTNNNKLLFKVGMLNTIATIVVIYIGASVSFLGVAIGYVSVYLLFVTPVTLYVICRFALNVSVLRFLKDISWSLFFSFIIYAINALISSLNVDIWLSLTVIPLSTILWLVTTFFYFQKFKLGKGNDSNKFSRT
ncbi:lipopolysaccharide biosynthesis protein [Vibrio parahaemolyticus]|uniref:lipopolysaccharide biosynthesis protein n=1 Tax=Vibrio parahaemolyticus TaxID=670 RepID=UPI00387A855D